MSKDELEAYYMSPEFSWANEDQMLRRLLENAKDFYQDPKNIQAYKVWLAKREATKNSKPDK